MKKKMLTGLAALIVFGLSTSASAVEVTSSQLSIHSVQVSFADLNIHSDAGAQALYTRLQNAAKKACLVSNSGATKPVGELRDAKSCYTSALISAVAKIDSAALQAIHSS